MSEPAGFNTDQLVIYKLGQIESALKNLSEEVKKFVNDQANQDEKIEAVENKVNNLETTYKVDKARILTLAGIIAFVITLGKELLVKWIGLSSLH